jgi:hypothetical protein
MSQLIRILFLGLTLFVKSARKSVWIFLCFFVTDIVKKHTELQSVKLRLKYACVNCNRAYLELKE